MWAGNKSMTATIPVDGVDITPGHSLELLGVTIDSKLSMESHLASVVGAARVRVSMVARLLCHLPCGPYLSQLSKGIIVG